MSDTQTWLEAFVAEHGGIAGTVHTRTDEATLTLAASVNIPEKVLAIVGTIPRGKGMAGLAFEHDHPISSCNIKDDKTGNVRPGAKAVDAQAAVALPVHDTGGTIRAVVGIAYAQERELTESELAGLSEAASALPKA